MKFKVSNETKVGVLAACALGILIFGVNFLKGRNIFSTDTTLYAKFSEVDGLGKSNPVLLHGMQVGRVDELILLNDENKIRVKFRIKGDVEVPKNSVAKIISSDILGAKAIELDLGNSKDLVANGDSLHGVVEPSLSASISKVVAPVKDKVEKLITTVDTVVSSLNEVFNDETKRNLKSSFKSVSGIVANLEKTTKTLDTFTKGETSRIKQILANVESISSNIKNNNGAITHAINNFSAISDSLRAANLKKTIEEVNSALAQVNGVIKDAKAGKGTLGKFLSDDRMYINLNNASRDLDLLIADMKEHPKRYVSFSLLSIGSGKHKAKKFPADTAGRIK